MDRSPTQSTAVYADIPDRRDAGAARPSARKIVLAVGLVALAVCATTAVLLAQRGRGTHRMQLLHQARRIPRYEMLGRGFHGKLMEDCVDRVFAFCSDAVTDTYLCGPLGATAGCGLPDRVVTACGDFLVPYDDDPMWRDMFKECVTRFGVDLSEPNLIIT